MSDGTTAGGGEVVVANTRDAASGTTSADSDGFSTPAGLASGLALGAGLLVGIGLGAVGRRATAS